MKPPEVIYSIATRLGASGLGIVSYNAVKALDEKGFLKKVVCYGNKSDMPKSKIFNLRGNPAKLLFFLPDHYYKPMRKGFLDYVTSKVINKNGCNVFHGWNNQALRSIKSAKKIGAKTILECGSTHRFFRERILEEEYKRHGIPVKKIPEYARNASLEELGLADFIFLPSLFAKKTFIDAGIKQEKLFVINRAVDLERYKPAQKNDERFRVLFVGGISLRKGVQYLLEAWKKLDTKNAELVLVGGIDEELKPIISKYSDMKNIIFKGFLKDPLAAYNEAAIFVFPSIEEGSAKVTYEAMAMGLPVITTENSGSMVRDGIDGFIIPIRNSGAIKDKINYFFENRHEIEKMGMAARENIKQYSWQRYRDILIVTYRKVCV